MLCIDIGSIQILFRKKVVYRCIHNIKYSKGYWWGWLESNDKGDSDSLISVPDFVPLPTEEVGCRADTQIKCPGSTSRICEVI